jgi:pyruvate dehydrogenase E2 component (dihydrolipoamide acetyltransferase)
MTVSPAALHRLGGEGPPVLLVHGFGADRYGWAANAHALMGTRTVWAVDLPGHGSAGNAVGDGSPAALAQGLAEAVEALPGPVPVVAHSLGGAVVLHAARLVPGAFDRMILISPAGLGQGIDGEFLASLPTLSTQEEAEALLARLVAKPRLVAPMAAHVLAGLADRDRRVALSLIGAALSAAPPPPSPDIHVSVLWGAEDRIVPLPRGPVLGIEPEVIAGAGHLPHVEAAGAVNRHIRMALEVQ